MTTLLTLADAVATHARLRPAKLALRDSKRRLSYQEWDERATRLAAAMRGLGLRKGDRVGVVAYNCLEWMEIYAGMAGAGLVVVPLNFRLSGAEMAYILGHAEVAAMIAGKQFCAVLDGVRADIGLSEQRWICLDDAPPAGWTAYESLMAQADASMPPVTVSADDMCALMYTSGTTGRPKGAVRSHGGNALIAVATALEMGFTSEDTALLVMPLCHANSLYFGCTFVHLGGTIIIDDRLSFDAQALLQTLAQERVTFTSLVPTHYIMLLALPDEIKRQYDVQAVGKLMISSAPARQETKRGIMNLFPNGKLYELYGSTEAGWVTLLRPDEQLRKLGSVGREWACSGAIRLLNEQRQEVADGEVGELYSRTAYMFDGYWKNPEKTAEALDGVWCSVGDMARRDEDGYIWLVDRKSNMIISGGENIYPSEVEAVLGQHPQVRDVAVIGVPHEKWGETAKAIIVLKSSHAPTQDELRTWCRERLASFKCPTAFEFIADEQMPRTATGKILHRTLRQMYSEVPVIQSGESMAV
jgi:fatty-acyl-CoA synthase